MRISDRYNIQTYTEFSVVVDHYGHIKIDDLTGQTLVHEVSVLIISVYHSADDCLLAIALKFACRDYDSLSHGIVKIIIRYTEKPDDLRITQYMSVCAECKRFVIASPTVIVKIDNDRIDPADTVEDFIVDKGTFISRIGIKSCEFPYIISDLIIQFCDLISIDIDLRNSEMVS